MAKAKKNILFISLDGKEVYELEQVKNLPVEACVLPTAYLLHNFVNCCQPYGQTRGYMYFQDSNGEDALVTIVRAYGSYTDSIWITPESLITAYAEFALGLAEHVKNSKITQRAFLANLATLADGSYRAEDALQWKARPESKITAERKNECLQAARDYLKKKEN